MNKGHVQPAEVVNLNTLNEEMPPDETFALVKTSDMEVIRMVLPEGRDVPEHNVDGEISVQCLKGKVEFITDGRQLTLQEGDWLYLDRQQSHAITPNEDSVLLLTILFTAESQ